MRVKVYPGEAAGEVEVISSKSFAHRLMIACALSDAPSGVQMQGEWGEDIEATMNCIRSLGAGIEVGDKHTIVITPGKERVPVAGALRLDCHESGSTLRFLMPVAAALGVSCVFSGKGRLSERPVGAMTKLLSDHGCQVSGDRLPVAVSGRLSGGEFRIRGDISSQFITGLLFALPLLETDSRIVVTTQLESRPYVDMTIEVLTSFGISIEETGEGYFVKGKQAYRTPESEAKGCLPVIKCEGDWSNGAFMLAAGMAGGSVRCRGLNRFSSQGDRKILEILKTLGGKIDWNREEELWAQAGERLRPMTVDASQIPDLVPVVAVLMSGAEGKSSIENAGRLRMKESDRLTAVHKCLATLGIRVEERRNGLDIWGTGRVSGDVFEVEGYHDHRIVMAMAVGALVHQVPVIIEGAQAVEKSYPDFFRELERLGVRVEELSEGTGGKK